jgi:N-acetylneuraminate synthase/N,N'-diacetyllegionaminate synthase
MTDLAEVAAAVATIRAAGDPPLTLLHCVSSYPAAPEDYNLRAVRTLADTFGVAVGLSDHSLGLTVSLAAVALGASVIEKHLTLDRAMTGPDHRASLEPAEFGALVREARVVAAALGDGVKRPVAAELPLRAVARKSVVAARPIAAGRTIAAEDLAIRRPGTGLPPAHLDRVVGRAARVAIPAETPITAELLV